MIDLCDIEADNIAQDFLDQYVVSARGPYDQLPLDRAHVQRTCPYHQFPEPRRSVFERFATSRVVSWRSLCIDYTVYALLHEVSVDRKAFWASQRAAAALRLQTAGVAFPDDLAFNTLRGIVFENATVYAHDYDPCLKSAGERNKATSELLLAERKNRDLQSQIKAIKAKNKQRSKGIKQQLDAAKNELAECKEHERELSEKLAATEQTRKKLREKTNSTDKSLGKLRSKAQKQAKEHEERERELTLTLSATEEARNYFRKQAEEQETRIQTLTRKLDTVEEQDRGLQNRLLAAAVRRESQAKTEEALNARIQSLEAELARTNPESVHDAADCQALREALANTKARLEFVRDKAKQLYQAQQTLRDSIAAKEATINSLLKNTSERTTAHHTELERLRDALEAARMETIVADTGALEELRARVAAYESTINTLEAALERSGQGLTSALKRNKLLSGKNDRLEEANSDLTEQNNRQATTIEDLRSNMTEMIAQHQAQLNQLTERLERAASEGTDIPQLRAEINKLKGGLDDAQTRVATSDNAELAALRQQIGRFAQMIKTLARKNAVLRKQAETQAEAIAQLILEKSTAEQRLQQLNQTVENLSATETLIVSSDDDLLRQLQECESEKARLNAVVNELQARLKHAGSETTPDAQETIARLGRELDRLQTELHKANRAISALKKSKDQRRRSQQRAFKQGKDEALNEASNERLNSIKAQLDELQATTRDFRAYTTSDDVRTEDFKPEIDLAQEIDDEVQRINETIQGRTLQGRTLLTRDELTEIEQDIRQLFMRSATLPAAAVFVGEHNLMVRALDVFSQHARVHAQGLIALINQLIREAQSNQESHTVIEEANELLLNTEFILDRLNNFPARTTVAGLQDYLNDLHETSNQAYILSNKLHEHKSNADATVKLYTERILPQQNEFLDLRKQLLAAQAELQRLRESSTSSDESVSQKALLARIALLQENLQLMGLQILEHVKERKTLLAQLQDQKIPAIDAAVTNMEEGDAVLLKAIVSENPPTPKSVSKANRDEMQAVYDENDQLQAKLEEVQGELHNALSKLDLKAQDFEAGEQFYFRHLEVLTEQSEERRRALEQAQAELESALAENVELNEQPREPEPLTETPSVDPQQLSANVEKLEAEKRVLQESFRKLQSQSLRQTEVNRVRNIEVDELQASHESDQDKVRELRQQRDRAYDQVFALKRDHAKDYFKTLSAQKQTQLMTVIFLSLDLENRDPRVIEEKLIYFVNLIEDGIASSEAVGEDISGILRDIISGPDSGGSIGTAFEDATADFETVFTTYAVWATQHNYEDASILAQDERFLTPDQRRGLANQLLPLPRSATPVVTLGSPETQVRLPADDARSYITPEPTNSPKLAYSTDRRQVAQVWRRDRPTAIKNREEAVKPLKDVDEIRNVTGKKATNSRENPPGSQKLSYTRTPHKIRTESPRSRDSTLNAVLSPEPREFIANKTVQRSQLRRTANPGQAKGTSFLRKARKKRQTQAITDLVSNAVRKAKDELSAAPVTPIPPAKKHNKRKTKSPRRRDAEKEARISKLVNEVLQIIDEEKLMGRVNPNSDEAVEEKGNTPDNPEIITAADVADVVEGERKRDKVKQQKNRREQFDNFVDRTIPAAAVGSVAAIESEEGSRDPNAELDEFEIVDNIPAEINAVSENVVDESAILDVTTKLIDSMAKSNKLREKNPSKIKFDELVATFSVLVDYAFTEEVTDKDIDTAHANNEKLNDEIDALVENNEVIPHDLLVDAKAEVEFVEMLDRSKDALDQLQAAFQKGELLPFIKDNIDLINKLRALYNVNPRNETEEILAYPIQLPVSDDEGDDDVDVETINGYAAFKEAVLPQVGWIRENVLNLKAHEEITADEVVKMIGEMVFELPESDSPENIRTADLDSATQTLRLTRATRKNRAERIILLISKVYPQLQELLVESESDPLSTEWESLHAALEKEEANKKLEAKIEAESNTLKKLIRDNNELIKQLEQEERDERKAADARKKADRAAEAARKKATRDAEAARKKADRQVAAARKRAEKAATDTLNARRAEELKQRIEEDTFVQSKNPENVRKYTADTENIEGDIKGLEEISKNETHTKLNARNLNARMKRRAVARLARFLLAHPDIPAFTDEDFKDEDIKHEYMLALSYKALDEKKYKSQLQTLYGDSTTKAFFEANGVAVKGGDAPFQCSFADLA